MANTKIRSIIFFAPKDGDALTRRRKKDGQDGEAKTRPGADYGSDHNLLIAKFAGSQKSKRVEKNICFCFIDYAKAFACVDHNRLWKILKEMRRQTT